MQASAILQHSRTAVHKTALIAHLRPERPVTEWITVDDDFDADEEDKEFLKEITKPAKKPATPAQIARQQSNASKQSAKREQSWAGNGLGSGSLQ